MPPNNNIEAMREEWNKYQEKSRITAARYGKERLNSFDNRSKSTADWWLSKFSDLQRKIEARDKELVERVEKIHYKYSDGKIRQDIKGDVRGYYILGADDFYHDIKTLITKNI